MIFCILVWVYFHPFYCTLATGWALSIWKTCPLVMGTFLDKFHYQFLPLCIFLIPSFSPYYLNVGGLGLALSFF